MLSCSDGRMGGATSCSWRVSLLRLTVQLYLIWPSNNLETAATFWGLRAFKMFMGSCGREAGCNDSGAKALIHTPRDTPEIPSPHYNRADKCSGHGTQPCSHAQKTQACYVLRQKLAFVWSHCLKWWLCTYRGNEKVCSTWSLALMHQYDKVDHTYTPCMAVYTQKTSC